MSVLLDDIALDLMILPSERSEATAGPEQGERLLREPPGLRPCVRLIVMPIERTDFENLSAADLQELLDARVPEGLRIEYKRELYGNRDEDKRECLKDILCICECARRSSHHRD